MAELLQMAQANAEVVLRCVIARPRAFMMHARYRCSNIRLNFRRLCCYEILTPEGVKYRGVKYISITLA